MPTKAWCEAFGHLFPGPVNTWPHLGRQTLVLVESQVGPYRLQIGRVIRGQLLGFACQGVVVHACPGLNLLTTGGNCVVVAVLL